MIDGIKQLLQHRLGLHFDGPAELRLRQALAQQIGAQTGAQTGAQIGEQPGAQIGVADGPTEDTDRLGEYLQRLHTDAAELDALTSLLTIKESYFYREPAHLQLLTETLAPRFLAQHRDGSPVRILSVGCAAGEEPYSIRMALVEAYGEAGADRFAITGCDIDRAALASARRGVYRRYALRALTAERRARWFHPRGNATDALDPVIRRGVQFQPLNLVAPTWPAALGEQDLIFYRNLSIYFDAPTRARVLERLRQSLQPHGALIVGLAEGLANDLGVLHLCEAQGIWYFTRQPRSRPALQPRFEPRSKTQPETQSKTQSEHGPLSRPASQPALATLVASAPAAAGAGTVTSPAPQPRPSARPVLTPVHPNSADPAAAQEEYDQALALARAEREEAALARLAPLCDGATPLVPALVLQAYLLAARGERDQATASATRAVQDDCWAVDALVLLGRLARARGDHASACNWLRRAVYAQVDAWPAHWELGECHRDRRDLAAAQREYRIVLRLLGNPARARASAGPLPAALPLADLRQLCRARLAALDAAA